MPYSYSRYGKRAPPRKKKARGENLPHKVGWPWGYLVDVVDGKLRLSESAKEKMYDAERESGRSLHQFKEAFESARRSNIDAFYPPEERERHAMRNRSRELHDEALPKLVELRRKRAERKWVQEYFREKRLHKQYMKKIFDRSIGFVLPDKKKVRILSYGFENIFSGRENTPTRAFVGVFVNGKRIYFYRSSGESSGHPNRWFPCGQVYVFEEGGTQVVGHIRKIVGHPSRGIKPQFPAWVDLVAQRIEAAVKKGKIKLHERTTADDFKRFQDALEFFPHLETTTDRESWSIPE